MNAIEKLEKVLPKEFKKIVSNPKRYNHHDDKIIIFRKNIKSKHKEIIDVSIDKNGIYHLNGDMLRWKKTYKSCAGLLKAIEKFEIRILGWDKISSYLH